MFEEVPELDVREDIRQGGDPFTRITTAAGALPLGGRLRLIAPFKPEPMIRLLSERGYQCAAQEIEGGDWAVLVERVSAGAPDLPGSRPACPKQPAATVLEVDARGLEPPEPMMRVLETVETLQPGQRLDARTDRRPVYLHAQLEERGFRTESRELEDGSVLTQIWRRDG